MWSMGYYILHAGVFSLGFVSLCVFLLVDVYVSVCILARFKGKTRRVAQVS